MLERFARTTLAPDSGEPEKGLALDDIINFAWRQWMFIGTIAGVVLVIGTVLLLRETRLYTATAQILLDPRKEKIGGDTILSDPNLDGAALESQVEIIRSTVLLRRVAEKERAAVSAEVGVAPPTGSALLSGARGVTADAARSRTGADGEAIPTDILPLIDGLRAGTMVTRSKGYMFTIAFTSVDPVRAAKLANAIADAYIVDKLDARFEAAKRASGWLSDRLTELRNQVRLSEEAVTKFRNEHNLLRSTTNVTLNQQQLGELNARLVAAKAELSEKKARVDLLQTSDGRQGAQSLLPDLINSPVVSALRGQIAGVAQREADLVARYGDRHPLVVNVRAERRDLERATNVEIQKLSANVRNEYELAKARVESLERSLQDVTGQSDSDNDAVITLRELERTATINRGLFEDFLQKAKLTQEQSTFEAREARVVTPALPPTSPSYPQKTRFTIITLFIGLMLGIGGAVAKELLNAGFTTPRQVEDFLDVPLLSSVSRMEQRNLTVGGKILQIPQYPIAKPLARFSESIRAIRSGVQMTDVDHPPRVIQITSTVPGEGKTTIGLSIATSSATSGLRVLFVDADLRRPAGSEFLGLKKSPGLVDLLLNHVNPQDVIRYNEDLRIWVLPAGAKTQNPTDLLGSERMKTHLEGFRKSFDFVIFDSPPVGPVIDPLVIAPLVDKVVFVVRWAVTAREMVKHSIQKLSGHRKVAGIVFNHINERQAQKYGRYAYSYYYSSRYYKNYYNE